MEITKDMIIGDILEIDRNMAGLLMACGMHCVGCPASYGESLEEACMVHGLDSDMVLGQLQEYMDTKAEQ